MFDFNLSLNSTVDTNTLWDLIIIGGGPAGLTAGLYAARYKLKVLMIEKQQITGGQMAWTEWVENYPGFPEPVLGKQLSQDMEKQAKLFGLQLVNESVNAVELKGKIKYITTDYATYQAKTVLITTGATHSQLGVPGEKENYGKGVSYCATCDGPFFPDKVVAVVGGGNSAVEESLFLAKYAKEVHIFQMLDHLTADAIVQDKAKLDPKLHFHYSTQIENIDFTTPTERKITYRNLVDNSLQTMVIDGIFIFIGMSPNTSLFQDQLALTNGYIQTDCHFLTSEEAVYAAGDVINKELRQVATAVGDGAEAAFRIYRYLEEQHA